MDASGARRKTFVIAGWVGCVASCGALAWVARESTRDVGVLAYGALVAVSQLCAVVADVAADALVLEARRK
jgi:MFS-type transporter involved in bile tolerance (Atg22 family)